MDFKISVKYPLFNDRLSKKLPDSRLYFAFTGRWGQYIGDRYSSPVIAKRFNPKLFWRQNLNYVCQERKEDGTLAVSKHCEGNPDKVPGTYIEAAIGHESNGQTISSAK